MGVAFCPGKGLCGSLAVALRVGSLSQRLAQATLPGELNDKATRV